MADSLTSASNGSPDDQSRRDFLLYASTAVGVTGTGLALWPFIHSMNPSADTLAMSSTEVDLTPIAEGQAITVTWRGKPVFIRHRTAAEIDAASQVTLTDLRDPESDETRVKKPQWLILVGICTHLGCIPLGQKPSDPRGEYGGWYCPCHGSVYDTSGRIRQGPAPANLAVPNYTFLSDTSVRIG
ncbi:MAG TPA: ubiquinol-cytochrome c reductase iron-sulfur subunit [Rhodospirillaceae bacterium]|nr:ubiquinol-cytochrome c reductase iron-sulfur subunit [Rhodospirillaceae bacterium]